MECPNCNHRSYNSHSRCNCTWDEQAKAYERIRENERRKREEKNDKGERKPSIFHFMKA